MVCDSIAMMEVSCSECNAPVLTLPDGSPILHWRLYGRQEVGKQVGRRRDELSLFELLKDQDRSKDSAGDSGNVSGVHADIHGGPGVPSVSDPDQSKGSRRKVQLEDRAKTIPQNRPMPPLPESLSSAPEHLPHRVPSPGQSFLSESIEVRVSAILVFGLAALVAVVVAYIAGRELAVVSAPAGMVELQEDSLFPVLDPAPELRPVIRNVEQVGVADSVVLEETAPVSPVVTEVLPQTLWAVMIGQHLSQDPQVVDQLVQYVDSGLSSSQSRLRASTSRGGRTFSVFVGPFEEQDAARSALREIQSLRPHLGVRFRDAYPTRMVFSPEELEKYDSGS
ncbi:MAG: hypothetical protein AAEJ04_00040 [Planctomycetota bacterium]